MRGGRPLGAGWDGGKEKAVGGKEGRSAAAAENRGKRKREEKGKEGERDRSTVKLGYTKLSSNGGKDFEKDFIG